MGLKFANCNTSVGFGDRIVDLREDQAWRDDDPFVVARPEFFNDRPVHVFGVEGVKVERVEKATRRPGEKRGH